MAVLPIKLPDVGEGVTEAELVEWNVVVGDLVHEYDILAAVMTDKATVEIPSLYTGTVVKLAGEIGDSLPVGSDLVLIETDASAPVEAAPSESAIVDAPPKEQTAAKVIDATEAASKGTTSPPSSRQPISPTASTGAPRPEGTVPLASPAVRARAREGGIDLRQVAGTGPAGRITQQDIDAVFSASSGSRPATLVSGRARRTSLEEIKIVGMRRRIADRMALANTEIPHITVVEEVDMTSLEDLRAKLNDDRGDRPKLTLLPFITAMLSRALVDHPEMNAHFSSDAGVVTRYGALHIGIATMTDAGLMVPVLKHAEALGLFETAAEIGRLSEAARSGKASRDGLTGSTFTITSLGPYGAIATTPIINHPEVAILGINKMAVRPIWDGSDFVPRTMMNISASFDHRIIDGWDAAVFVQRMKTLLETPALIFAET